MNLCLYQIKYIYIFFFYYNVIQDNRRKFLNHDYNIGKEISYVFEKETIIINFKRNVFMYR